MDQLLDVASIEISAPVRWRGTDWNLASWKTTSMQRQYNMKVKDKGSALHHHHHHVHPKTNERKQEHLRHITHSLFLLPTLPLCPLPPFPLPLSPSLALSFSRRLSLLLFSLSLFSSRSSLRNWNTKEGRTLKLSTARRRPNDPPPPLNSYWLWGLRQKE